MYEPKRKTRLSALVHNIMLAVHLLFSDTHFCLSQLLPFLPVSNAALLLQSLPPPAAFGVQPQGAPSPRELPVSWLCVLAPDEDSLPALSES